MLPFQVREAQGLVNTAKGDAQMAYDKAMEAKNISESSRAELQDLLNRISEFLKQQGARPADIRAVSTQFYSLIN